MKKGYHKVSLRVHPDRVSPKEKEEATKKFQALGRVYSILSDENKRGLYDETGTSIPCFFVDKVSTKISINDITSL